MSQSATTPSWYHQLRYGLINIKPLRRAYARSRYVLRVIKSSRINQKMLSGSTASKRLVSASSILGSSTLKPGAAQLYQQKRQKPKIVIYSAIIGAYDQLTLPLLLDGEIDYVLFTDQKIDGQGVVEIRSLPFKKRDAARQVRYIKLHPHTLFPDHDLAIWVDANIRILGDIQPLITAFKSSKKPVGLVPHSKRRSLYEEAAACLALGKGEPDLIRKQVAHYQKLGFEHNDLATGGIIFYDLNSSKLESWLNDWWQEILDFSARDQLSINYTMAKNKVEWFRLMEPPQHAGNHPLFTLAPHQKESRS